jgi:hypothetical protein
MELQLQLLIIFAAVLTYLYILYQIKKMNVNVKDTVVWFLFALLLIVMSLIPNLLVKITHLLGFEILSNFVFFFFIGLMFLVIFRQSLQISNLEKKLKKLAQEVAIRDYKDEKK